MPKGPYHHEKQWREQLSTTVRLSEENRQQSEQHHHDDLYRETLSSLANSNPSQRSSAVVALVSFAHSADNRRDEAITALVSRLYLEDDPAVF